MTARAWTMVALCAVAALAGCDRNAHDVEWFKTHEAERRAALAKCANDPGRLALTAECVNATKARDDLRLDSRNTEIPSIGGKQ
ncbi:exported hypothetical protein [Burkholderia latens]|uniref:EexN family lipoprotein n=1 Tax=Burkholderia latens TaxID=488446 RepID=UPI0039A67AA9